MNEFIGRRIESPGAGTKEVQDAFNAWCEILTAHSLQASYAIIAANWAVHRGLDAILGNAWAKWSMAVVVAFLGFNLLATGWMAYLHYRQMLYAGDDSQRWEREYQQELRYWPYTKKIENLGCILRVVKVVAPCAAAVLFVISLF